MRSALRAAIKNLAGVDIVSTSGNTMPETPPPPETTLTGAPRAKTFSAWATFTFESNRADASFLCRLDGWSWAPCTSPTFYKVRRGWPTFEVMAVDAGGQQDASPATDYGSARGTSDTRPTSVCTARRDTRPGELAFGAPGARSRARWRKDLAAT